jgi:hypothetical protein
MEQNRAQFYKFDLDKFKSISDEMISQSTNSYENYFFHSDKRYKQYKREDIPNIIYYGSKVAKRELSYSYYCTNNMYSRIIIYYASLLKYQWLLSPRVKKERSAQVDKKINSSYYSAIEFIDQLQIKEKCFNFMMKIFRDGCYYGVISDSFNEYKIIDLPFTYCRNVKVNIYGEDIIEFNLNYFNTFFEGKDREKILKLFPKYFQTAYKKFESNKIGQWIIIPQEISVCFSGYEGIPFFLPTIEKIANLTDYEKLEQDRDESETKRLLIQKVPHTQDGNYLFEPDEASEIHKASVGMMKNNKNFSVLTTYLDVDIPTTNSLNETVSKNNLEKITNTIYSEAGVSRQLFSATGNLALDKSISNDISFVMYFINKISNFFEKVINNYFATNKFDFSFTILPISVYNEDTYLSNALKASSQGYSLLLPAIALGISQSSLSGLKDLENKELKLLDKLIPNSTSYTASANDPGAPQKVDSEKKDRTLANEKSKDGGSNE